MKRKRLLTLVGSICLILVLAALLLPACAEEEALVTPTPAEFEVISLDVEPTEVTAGETVTITAVVGNTGGSEGTYAAVLTVDGATVEAKEVTITPGSSKVVTFSLIKDAPGTYEIGIGELSSTLIVKETAKAKIEITFNPNPVPCEDGHWYWRVILTEVNGIGVKLSSLSMEIHGNHEVITRNYESSTIAEWLGSAYLPAYSSEDFGAGFPCQAITYEIVTVTGIDDKGHEITATGRVDFLQPD